MESSEHRHSLEAILDAQIEILRRLKEIEKLLKSKQQFTITIKEFPMAIGTIAAGTTGQFGAALLDNGAAYVAPAGSTYVFAPTFTASDATVTFAPATTDTSGGTIPLADQTVVTVPAGDLGTSLTITATATAPDGTVATGTITVALTPEAQKFTIAVTQLA